MQLDALNMRLMVESEGRKTKFGRMRIEKKCALLLGSTKGYFGKAGLSMQRLFKRRATLGIEKRE